MGEPPTLAGGVKDTEAVVAEVVILTIDGIPGAKAYELVITRLTAPLGDTATKRPFP